jgi:hypothetical protein
MSAAMERPLPSGLRVLEVEDGDFFAGELFRRTFQDDLPPVPRYFVALARLPDGCLATAGFVHFLRYGDAYLGGGMCIDPRVLRRLPEAARRELAGTQGIAWFMLRHAIATLTDADALFGYVGSARALQIDLAAGFERTPHERLVIHPQRAMPAEARDALVARIAAVGPF